MTASASPALPLPPGESELLLSFPLWLILGV